jgi:hypothetical protein
MNLDLAKLVIDYLDSKYPDEFTTYDHWVLFKRGVGYAHWFIRVEPNSVGFFQPALQDEEISVPAALPEFFDYVDKYAELYFKEAKRVY